MSDQRLSAAPESGAYRKPDTPKEDLELVRAVRAIIAEQTGNEPKAPEPAKLDWASFFYLAVFAADLSLAYALIKSAFDLEIPQFAIGLIPSLLGVAFVAYTDALRAWLISVARRWVFRITVLVLAVVLAIPQMITYQVRVSIHPGAWVSVDDVPVGMTTQGSDTTIAVHGLIDHRIRISEFQAKDRREDILLLRRGDMIRASLQSWPLFGRLLGREPLALDTRWPVAVAVPDQRITFFRIFGKVPTIYRTAYPRSGWFLARSAADTYEIRMAVAGGSNVPKIYLPPSRTPYRVSYVFDGCESQPATVTVTGGGTRTVRPLPCVQPQAGKP